MDLTAHSLTPDWPAPDTVGALQTTRTGGSSVSPYDSFNLGSHVKDNPLAVARNRMRRRFREALRTTPGLPLAPGTDYVIVARRAALATDFASLRNALAGALERILKERPRGGGQNRRGGADTTRPRTP